MKNLFLFCTILILGFYKSQVGINTPIPKATLDVEGQATSPTTIDGFIPLRLTGDQLKQKITFIHLVKQVLLFMLQQQQIQLRRKQSM